MDSISNSPSFSLQRQRSEKVGRLELLSNLIPGKLCGCCCRASTLMIEEPKACHKSEALDVQW